MERKKCIKCGSWKEISEYQLRDKTGKHRNECRDCVNVYHRLHYKRKMGKFKREIRAESREANPKRCIRCEQEKPLSDFGWHNIEKGQHRNFCKVCQKEWDREYKCGAGKLLIDNWKEKNKDKIIAYRELYRNDPINKEKMKQHGRKHTLKCVGVTQEDYDRMFQVQEGKCKICGSSQNGKKNFCVDHNHETGKVRGLLCHNCNVSVGLMKDDPSLLRQAADYLETY